MQFPRFTPLLLVLAAAAAFLAGPGQAAKTQIATVAGGCFWCVESDFESVKGVKRVVSGYTGGHTDNPTYKQVSRGGTGHYEAVQIYYDPARVSYAELMHLFMRSVDPTDAGGQFCDRGDSYRPAIFVANADERAIAEQAVAEARAALGKRIAIKVWDSAPVYQAEDDHHQDEKRNHA